MSTVLVDSCQPVNSDFKLSDTLCEQMKAEVYQDSSTGRILVSFWANWVPPFYHLPHLYSKLTYLC